MIYIETKQQTQNKNLILEIIEEVIGVPRELWEVKRSRSTEEVFIRDIYIYMLYTYADMRYENIIRLVDLKNHASAIQSVNKAKKWINEPNSYSIKLKLLNEIIKKYEDAR
jgi:chromosomal replication initiation ATPase DnaA